MRIFHCDHCHQPVFFENTRCAGCGQKLAYLPDLQIIGSLDPLPTDESDNHGEQRWTSPLRRAEGRQYRLCENYTKYSVCNWALPAAGPERLCPSCQLTTVIPDLSVEGNLEKWARLEMAKRRLVYSLIEFKLLLKNKHQDPASGLEFHFKGDPTHGPRVLTGHDNGIITMNIIEADDVERERARVSMHEPYRTLLGHFRHEIGHYYWDRLIKDTDRLESFRSLFGDESTDYTRALVTHYETGPRRDWREHYISAYASVHPWEDWAETWAHYLHMTDTIETAAACGLSLTPDRDDEPSMKKPQRKPAQQQSFDEIIIDWFPLTYVLNNLNRGMGLSDAYPFVLPPPTIEKLRFVHDTICKGASRPEVISTAA